MQLGSYRSHTRLLEACGNLAGTGGRIRDGLRIHGGGNGGYQAVNLALLLGARQILLLGYDLATSPTGRLHSYPNHGGVLANPDSDCFLRWRKSFETMVPDLERAAIDIVNCSPASALDCFPKAPLEAVL